MTQKKIFQTIIDKNPLGYIYRKDIAEKTGGLLNPRTLANLDCKGIGIQNRFRIGRQVCYQVQNVVDFLESKLNYEGFNDTKKRGCN